MKQTTNKVLYFQRTYQDIDGDHPLNRLNLCLTPRYAFAAFASHLPEALKIKRIASPIALSILVSTPAYAAPITYTYTDQTFTTTIEFDSTGAAGHNGNTNGSQPDGWDGDPGSDYVLNFIQGNGGPGNTITAVGGGISLSSTGGSGGYPGSNDNYGGNGGSANVGGDLTITSSGKLVITASGDQAHGIQASSVGGVGAHGNDSNGNNYYAGTGGIGGAGGAVTVTLGAGATVTTNGTGSNAIFAQSIGGLAGDDGTSSSNNGDRTQPNGPLGGVTGLVSVTLDEGATLQTQGNQSNGIAATSLSGNGGAGANSDGGWGTASGGQGGNGGPSGGVAITSNGSIITSGTLSAGITAQSMSGGGGRGGNAGALISTVSGGPGTGGPVGDINITNTGLIQTSGSFSQGILAQSISGGGGVGGTASGSLFYDAGANAADNNNAGAINVTHEGSSAKIVTSGDFSQGIVAQSVGGGGGQGGPAGGMIVVQGGTAGVGGNGGDVTLNLNAPIQTSGISSHGAVAQSIAGGGGLGGTATAGGAQVSTAVGGTGGLGGAGGNAVISMQGGQATTNGSAAIGILSQSIGGGGGAGGGAYSTSAGAILDVAVAVGGQAGDGGDGGTASVALSNSTVSTAPNPSSVPQVDSIGVVVQSIGGGGGVGGNGNAAGYSIAIPLPTDDPNANLTFTGAFAVGGKGGNGGAGGSAQAQINNGTQISTGGAGSTGLLIQSIGGGGGHGGDSSTLAASIGYGIPQPVNSDIAPVTNTVDLSVAVGAAGGDGGDGQTAELLTLGDTEGSGNALTKIITTGADAAGAVVQSIGGGGGNSGVGNAKVASYATSQHLDLKMTVGSSGGGNGNGGQASAAINQLGAIMTSGASAEGLLVQSIGGSGGIGSGGSLDLSGLASWMATVAGLPSGGGVPQSGISHETNISVGAQSGDGGGTGGAASVINLGAIQTSGVDSPAIMAQSIGGGGGIGGSMIGSPVAAASAVRMQEASSGPSASTVPVPVSVTTTLSVGGGQGSVGDGGSATVTHSGTIITVGDYSPGIIAQSVGAGGGRASGAILGVDVGGALSHAMGSVGGALNVTNTITVGYGASESTLGFGNVLVMGAGGAATVNLNEGAVSTGAPGSDNGFQSFGVLAQSIGGGGGIATDGTSGPYGAISVGALAGTGSQTVITGLQGEGLPEFGAGGTAIITDKSAAGGGTSVVTTSGDAAYGLFAQSVGGGGGIAAVGSSQTAAGGGGKRFMTIGLGAGGVLVEQYIDGPAVEPVWGGDGGPALVDLQTTATSVSTSGNGAIGILAQSIGGGGGTVAVAPGTGSTISYLGSQPPPDSSGPLEGQSLGGNGGNVTVSVMNTGSSIATSGVGAHGIMAQSVGGGGGLVANYRDGTTPTLSNNFTTTSAPGAARGNGGNIAVSSYGTIMTTGNGAFGILAQSIGAGGGLVVNDDGTVFANAIGTDMGSGSGTIAIDVHNSIQTTGVNSNGIWAQSVAPNGNNFGAITIDLEDAAQVSGGSGQGAGILVDGGTSGNKITVGAGTSVGALSGQAIQVVDAKVNVVNNGTIHGGTALGSSEQLLAAPSPGSSAITVGVLTNSGSLIAVPGKRSYVDGHFIQTAKGRIVPNLDYSNGISGEYVVTGSATLDGTIEPTLASAMPNRYLPVLTTEGPTTGTLRTPDSPLFAYTMRQTGNRRDIAITGTHFSTPELGLNEHKSGVARTLENVFASGNADLGPFFADLDATARADLGNYQDAIGELSPRSTMTLLSRVAADASRIADASMSCPEFASDSGQGNSILVEGECAYFVARGNSTSLDRDSDRGSSRMKSYALQGGEQREIRPGLLLGGSLAYQANTFSGDDGVTADGNSVQGAITLKKNLGAWQVSGAVFGNYGQYDTKRRIAAPGFSATAKGDAPTYSVGLRGRLAYTAGTEQLYLRPSVNLDLVHAKSGSFDETGAGDLGLKIGSSTYNTAILTPEIEIGGRTDLKNGGVLRTFALAGVSLRSNDEWEGQASFNGGAHSPSFGMQAPLDRAALRLGTGVQLFATKQMDVQVRYDAELGSEAKSHNLTAKLAYHF